MERKATSTLGEPNLEAIRRAFEIEMGGLGFYLRAEAETNDGHMKLLFGKFAQMEREHLTSLSRRYHVPMPAPASVSAERAALYAGVTHKPQDPGNLFRIAIGFEERAVNYFTQHEESQPPGSAERHLYRELAAEEREHVALLTTEFEQWKRGRAGII